MKTAQFCPKPASIVDATTALRILKNKRNLQISKKEFIAIRKFYLPYLLV